MKETAGSIISTETRDQLEARSAELRKVLKLKLILNEVRSMQLSKDEKTAEIRRALKLLSVDDFIRLGDGTDHLLDLQDCIKCFTLSYTDRKTLHNKLTANLSKKLTPIIELGDRIRSELPDVLTTTATISGEEEQLTSGQQEIIRLQEQQREYLEKLVEKRQEKCQLMLMAADLKMGPHFGYELKVQLAQTELLHTKTDLMRKYIIYDILSRSEHSLKAYKEVEKYLDELLSQAK